MVERVHVGEKTGWGWSLKRVQVREASDELADHPSSCILLQSAVQHVRIQVFYPPIPGRDTGKYTLAQERAGPSTLNDDVAMLVHAPLPSLESKDRQPTNRPFSIHHLPSFPPWFSFLFADPPGQNTVCRSSLFSSSSGQGSAV